MKKLTKNIASSLLKPRAANTHKGSFGHSLIIAGSKGTMGAAVIAAKACLRSGTGLLTVNVPQKERIILQTTIPEAMFVMREDKELDIAKYIIEKKLIDINSLESFMQNGFEFDNTAYGMMVELIKAKGYKFLF